MQALMEDQRRQIIEADASVTGFNIGINAGKDAGQTIFHCHMHLIPRRVGDVEDPRGGVRGVIPSKQKY
jgi:diadenosine tetraphosphate (Ap4A) HIT family hydrolase